MDPKISNLKNYKNWTFGKNLFAIENFQKFPIWKISKIVSSESYENLQFEEL